jgi:hypothetical protein
MNGRGQMKNILEHIANAIIMTGIFALGYVALVAF